MVRQKHRAGEKMFVDHAGRTAQVVDPYTGEMREVQIFVAVLGASNYTFAEATRTQTPRHPLFGEPSGAPAVSVRTAGPASRFMVVATRRGGNETTS